MLMIGELYENLPVEIVWNIIKFTRHPCAELMKPYTDEYTDYMNYKDEDIDEDTYEDTDDERERKYDSFVS